MTSMLSLEMNQYLWTNISAFIPRREFKIFVGIL